MTMPTPPTEPAPPAVPNATVTLASSGGRPPSVFFTLYKLFLRTQITRTLDLMGVRYVSAINGGQMWAELLKVASYADSSGRKVNELISMILTDVEMPEMDGYILTKNIKADPRFAGIPVVMHSSLSSGSNQQLGRSVGVDEYVSKFEAQRLAETITRLIRRSKGIDRVAA